MADARQKTIPPAQGGGALIVNFHATPLNVREALGTLLTYLAPLGLPPDQRDTIQLVLAEALNNVTEHAYPAGAGGPIYLRALAECAELTVIIRDRGVPLPAELILSEGKAGRDPADLPEGGFGWHLIRSLASALDHNRLARWNELKVVFSLARFAGGPACHQIAPKPSE